MIANVVSIESARRGSGFAVPVPQLPAESRHVLTRGELRRLRFAGVASDLEGGRVAITGFVFDGWRAVRTDLAGLVTHVDGVPVGEYGERFPTPLDCDRG